MAVRLRMLSLGRASPPNGASLRAVPGTPLSSAPITPLSAQLKPSRNTVYLHPEDLTKLRQLSGYASTEHGMRANGSMIVRRNRLEMEPEVELTQVYDLLASNLYLEHPEVVARNLLGKLLIRKFEGESLIGRIAETEAYLGENDPAAHSFAGRTARTEVIFGPPGRAYVYFIYGVHYCLNVSCEPEGQAGCVLIRALEPIAGLATMAKLRRLPPTASPRLLTSGPGKLCQALAITLSRHNGIDLTDAESELRIVDDGYLPASIAVTPRIGISKASAAPLRFFVDGNQFVSGPPARRRKA